MAVSTWSTTDKTNVTLTGSNLIATASANVAGVRGKDPKRAGKYYIEYTSTTTQSISSYFGFAIARSTLTANSPNTAVVNAQGGAISIWDDTSHVNYASIGAITTSSLIGCAIDLDNRLIWFRLGAAGNWNDSGTANPATGVGGLDLAPTGFGTAFDVYPFVYLNTSGNAITANFGGTAFTGTVPSGFTSGWDDSVALVTNLVTTQMGAEAFIIGTSDLQVTQAGLEVFYNPNPDLQVSQLGVEAWAAGTPDVRLTQIGIEAWAQITPANVVLTQVGVEAWVSVAGTALPGGAVNYGMFFGS